MAISLIRVDDRLIHGQVVLMWSKFRQGDAMILLVDETISNDSFMKNVYKNAGNSIGKKVYIFNVAQAIEKIPKAIASDKKYYVISKSIQQLYELSKNGIDFGNEIIIGNQGMRSNTKKVANNIYFTDADAEACDYLDNKGIKLLFKLIPDEAGIDWKAGKKIFNKGE